MGIKKHLSKKYGQRCSTNEVLCGRIAAAAEIVKISIDRIPKEGHEMSLFGRLFDFNGDGHASEEEEIFGMSMMDDYERKRKPKRKNDWSEIDAEEEFMAMMEEEEGE